MSTSLALGPGDRFAGQVRHRSPPRGAVLLGVATGAGSGRDPLVLTTAPSYFPRSPNWLRACSPRLPMTAPSDAETVLKSLVQVRNDLLGTGPERRPSGELPQPDPRELKSSAGGRATDYAVGDLIDRRFVVLQVLGEGAFSEVYRVRDELETEERALKLFPKPPATSRPARDRCA